MPSLDEKRSSCVLSITIAEGEITRPGTLSTSAAQMAFLTDLASLDNAFASLIHTFEVIRAMRPPSSAPSTVAVEQEHQVENIRKQLQSSYEALVTTALPRLVAERSGAPEGAAVSHQSGQISGQISNAESGSPLAGVVVTVESPQSPGHDQLQRTGEDGRYDFGGLAAGKYWVIAYRKGFAGSIYGMDTSQNALESTLTVEPGQKVEHVDFHLSPTPKVTPMNTDAGNSGFPPDAAPSMYWPGRFSPDGTRFAVAVRSGQSNDVRVYSVAEHRNEFIVKVPDQPNLSYSINGFTWVGGSLYAEAQSGMGGPIPLKITLDSIQRMNAIPGCESLAPGPPCIRPIGSPGPPPIPPEVQNAYWQGLARSLGVVANSHFIVTADNWPSGDVRLRSQTGNGHDLHIISTGDDNLKAFLLEAGSSIVLYPAPGGYFGGIVAYNLQIQQSQIVELPLALNLKLLDSISNTAGTLVAYTVDGSCVPPESASGEDPWLLPGKPMPAPRASIVCFVEVPHSPAN